jgi:N-methylhydantoinase B
VIETLAPIVMHRREYRRDSGGAGAFRGGLGQTMEVSIRTGRPFVLSPLFDRAQFAAQGYAGGQPGALGTILASTGEVIDRKGMREFPAGTVVTLQLPGGGGIGNPFERDPQAVLADVRDGLVSVESARYDYGVVIDERTLTLDPDATMRERQRRSSPEPVAQADPAADR